MASQSDSHVNRPLSSRRTSTASTALSIGGSLDTSTRASTVFETEQNAIFTLLQPPNHGRPGLQPHPYAPASSFHKPPTTKDIPPVTLTNIPIVDPSTFRQYLSQIGALHEQLRRIKDDEDESHLSSTSRASKVDASDSKDDGLPRPRFSSWRKSSAVSLASVSFLDGNARRRSSFGFSRKLAQGPPPLSTIPNLYFEEGFRLENPRTFDIVSEHSEVVRPVHDTASADTSTANGNAAAPRKALATNAILQEKLSWYMDTVEMHLINSISLASSTFFTALGALRELHSEAASSVDHIRNLREDLKALDEEIATTGLDIVQTLRRQGNIHQLNETVIQLKQIVDGVKTCEMAVEAGNVESALDQLEAIEKLIAGERNDTLGSKQRLRDLRGAIALKNSGDDINTLRFRIGRLYEPKFQTQLLGDLRRHAEHVTLAEVLMRWTNNAQRAKGQHTRLPSATPSYMSLMADLKSAVAPNLLGLYRARHISAASMAYREAVLTEVRHWIKQPLPSSSDDTESVVSASTTSGGRHFSGQEKSAILARNLRALAPEEAEDMLATIYVKVTEVLRRLATQVKVLLDISSFGPSLSSFGMKSPPLRSPSGRSPLGSPSPGLERQAWRPQSSGFEMQEELHNSIDLANLLGQAVDVAQDKIARVLRVRSEQTKVLPLAFFLRYYNLNLLFVTECEAISGRGGSVLKSLVTGHIKDFVQQHGDSENRKLAQNMEADQWTTIDFGKADQDLLERIVASSTSDSATWIQGTSLWIPYNAETLCDDSTASLLEPANGDKREKSRPAQIDSQTFLLPSSAIYFLHGISQFFRLTAGIPLLTADIASTIISYLHLFNSRATQLILGAGAKRSAGLKNITTKHMALASQALSFIAALIPYIREFIRRHLGTRGPGAAAALMGDFDKVRHLLQEHRENISQKIVEMMRNRAAAAAKEMQTVDWDQDGAAVPSAHLFVESLSKDTNVLYRALSKHLPDPAVQMIMLPIFAIYREQLGRVLEEARPKTAAGRDCIVRDIDYMAIKMGKIHGFGDMAESFLHIVHKKEIEVEALVPAPASVLAPASVPAPDSADARPERLESPSERSASVPSTNGPLSVTMKELDGDKSGAG